MVSHGIESVGDGTAHVIGFFPDDESTAAFEQSLMPFGSTVVTLGGDR